MPVCFRCPRCAHTLSTAYRKIGEQVACPVCQVRVTVPDEEAGSAPRGGISTRLQSHPCRREPSRRHSPRRTWLHQGQPVALAAIAVVLFFALLFATLRRNDSIASAGHSPGFAYHDKSLSAAVPATDHASIEPSTKAPGASTEKSPPAAPQPSLEPGEQRAAAPAAPPEPARPEAKEPPPAKERPAQATPFPSEAVAFKRMHHTTDEDLRRQLLKVPEVGLDPHTTAAFMKSSRQPHGQSLDLRPTFVLNERPDLASLPFRMGDECRVGKEAAEDLQSLSRKLRQFVEASLPRDRVDVRPDADTLRTLMLNERDATAGPSGAPRANFPAGSRSKGPQEWLVPGAIPTLQQLLMAENVPIRLLLVDLLSQIKGSEATAALAQRAVFDLSFEVREAAVEALRPRPVELVRPSLLQAFRYPWSPAAEHAAEALVHLRDRDAVLDLIALLREPDPKLPFLQLDEAMNKEVLVVREVVRINHLSNCLLCHPVSHDVQDHVRGRVPVAGQPLPASASQAYGGDTGTFARADITYLKQDFSVPQPVDNPSAWPAHQRYDYLVRIRTPNQVDFVRLEQARLAEKKGMELSPGHRRAALFALRELTGHDAGKSPSAWLDWLVKNEKSWQ